MKKAFAASDGNKLSNSARRECGKKFAASDGNKLSNSARREFFQKSFSHEIF